MARPLLLDTEVLVDYLRNHSKAVTYLESQAGPLLISAISVAELYAGVRDGHERERLEIFLDAFEVLNVDRATAAKGGLLRRDFGSRQGTGLADALIAAQAIASGATLVTLNRKRFRMVRSLDVPYRRK